MVLFPNAKINIGLNIVRKRSDGYHDIETLFYPIGLKDGLEFLVNRTGKVNFTSSGINLDVSPENNITVKAYRLLADQYPLPGIDIHLHKVIPFGAGLGGGSSDAAFMLKGLNECFDLKLSDFELKQFALKLGADCSFFIENKPCFAAGVGEILEKSETNLKGVHLLIVKPPFGVDTKAAYSNIVPSKPQYQLQESLKKSPEQWREVIKNDFEPSVFRSYPEIENIKKTFTDCGAVYTSMSGSGSSVFGLFRSDPQTLMKKFPEEYFTWSEKL